VTPLLLEAGCLPLSPGTRRFEAFAELGELEAALVELEAALVALGTTLVAFEAALVELGTTLVALVALKVALVGLGELARARGFSCAALGTGAAWPAARDPPCVCTTQWRGSFATFKNFARRSG